LEWVEVVAEFGPFLIRTIYCYEEIIKHLMDKTIPLLTQIHLIKRIIANQQKDDALDLAFYFTCLAIFDFKQELPLKEIKIIRPEIKATIV